MAKFYLTTAIPYVNAKPHIGFAYEAIQSDVIARFHRLVGDEVYFLTGTDEHGSKNYKVALDLGITAQEYVDSMIGEFTKLQELLNLSYDDFIRTSDKKRHYPGSQKLWEECVKSGDIYKQTYKGFYCVGCEAFVTEKDLENDVCPIHKTKPELLEEENYFFKLSRYEKQIKELVEQDKLKIVPSFRKNEVLEFLKAGLEDISVSRPASRLPWGVPVPNDPNNVIYIWFDALANYITAIGYGTDEEKFNKWWPADLHVIGKDITRFHAVYWIGMLLSAGIATPKSIYIHGFITSGGEKMSKSLGNVIDPVEVANKYGEEPLRYYLLKEIPAGSDGDFTYERFEEVYTGDLANGVGNLVSRVATLCEKLELSAEKVEKELNPAFVSALENLDFSKAIEVINQEVRALDQEIQENKPWELVKNDPEKATEFLSNIVRRIQKLAVLLSPLLPKTADSINKIFSGKISKPETPLFPRLPHAD